MKRAGQELLTRVTEPGGWCGVGVAFPHKARALTDSCGAERLRRSSVYLTLVGEELINSGILICFKNAEVAIKANG